MLLRAIEEKRFLPMGSDQETVVFLSSEGVRLAVEGYADDIAVEGLSPLKELMSNFAAAGGQIYVCLPCFQKRGLDENNLVDGAVVVGGTALVAFMADGAPSVSFSPRCAARTRARC